MIIILLIVIAAGVVVLAQALGGTNAKLNSVAQDTDEIARRQREHLGPHRVSRLLENLNRSQAAGGALRGPVLIVETDNRLRDLLGRYLGSNGFSTISALTSAEAHLPDQVFPFKLVILGGAIGSERDEIDEIRALSDVPIIALSRAPRITAPGVQHLPKPFDPQKLSKAVEAIMPPPSTPPSVQ